MRKAVCLAVGAAAILLTVPAAAHRTGVAASSGRPTGYNRIGSVHRGGFVGPGHCFRQNRRCFANRFRRGFGFGLIGYDYGGLVVDPDSLRDQGFFADTGESWRENGRAVYDYDRGYPYDWYRDPASAAAGGGRRFAPGPMVRCDVSWVGGGRNGPAAVRVCRGRR